LGKFIAGLFRALLTIAICGTLAYLSWEVRFLRAEVAALKQQRITAVKSSGPKAKPSQTSSDLRDSRDPAGLLNTARQHLVQAETRLRQKDYSGAMRQLSAATEAARKAGDETQIRSQKSFAELQKAIVALKEKAETLGADREKSPAKPDGENQ
jgi:hypothetical protein